MALGPPSWLPAGVLRGLPAVLAAAISRRFPTSPGAEVLGRAEPWADLDFGRSSVAAVERTQIRPNPLDLVGGGDERPQVCPEVGAVGWREEEIFAVLKSDDIIWLETS